MANIKHSILSLALLSSLSGFANNYFNTLLGKSEEETKEKIESIWRHFFTPGDIRHYDEEGQHSVYYIDGDKGFILDTGSNDVRRMSYGMMICVQLDRPEVFDRLWRLSKDHMAYDTPASSLTVPIHLKTIPAEWPEATPSEP